MVACRLQSPSIDLSMIPVSTPTFLGVYCRGALSRQLALRALSSDVGSPPNIEHGVQLHQPKCFSCTLECRYYRGV